MGDEQEPLPEEDAPAAEITGGGLIKVQGDQALFTGEARELVRQQETVRPPARRVVERAGEAVEQPDGVLAPPEDSHPADEEGCANEVLEKAENKSQGDDEEAAEERTEAAHALRVLDIERDGVPLSGR